VVGEEGVQEVSFEKVSIGEHTLIRGDCLEVMADFPSRFRVDAVVTDPPYGVELKETRTKHRRTEAKYLSTDDTPENVLPMVRAAVSRCEEIAGRVVVTPGIRLLQDYPKAKDIGSIFFPNGAGVGPWGFVCSHPVLYYGRCPYLAKGMGSRPNGVSATHWNRRKDAEHPCEKPLQMMEWLVRRASLEGHSVIDPFMGSGTTGVACVNLGRTFMGIEKEQRYFDIACRRIEEAVAAKAVAA
jgi:site-specific DNA-methyltransferase (adenine-specific)